MGLFRVALACVGQQTFGHFEQASDLLESLKNEIESKRDEIPLRIVTGSVVDLKDDAQDMIDALQKGIDVLDDLETLAQNVMAFLPD